MCVCVCVCVCVYTHWLRVLRHGVSSHTTGCGDVQSPVRKKNKQLN